MLLQRVISQNVQTVQCLILSHSILSRSSPLTFGITKRLLTSQSDKGESSKLSSSPRKKLIILGTGWGSYSVLKSINKSLYDVIVVSPRNHFLFTPLLTSTTVGTLEFR